MMSPSIFISWTSLTPATGEETDTSVAPSLAVSFMKAPVPLWPGTLVRTQASFTSTDCACTMLPIRAAANTKVFNVMGCSKQQVNKSMLVASGAGFDHVEQRRREFEALGGCPGRWHLHPGVDALATGLNHLEPQRACLGWQITA